MRAHNSAKSPLLPLADAYRVVDRAVSPIAGRELVPLEAAGGRVLAKDVRSDVDSPPFDRSAVDGYAVLAADLAVVPARFRVAAVIAAGNAPRRIPLRSGEAARIFTGAPVPPGADAVVMQEATDSPPRPVTVGDEITVRGSIRPGTNIAPRGQELRRGAIALRAGSVVGPAEVAILSAVGRVSVLVRRAVSVALLSTGDELVHASERPGRSRIRNTNSACVRALLAGLPVRTTDLGIARDDPRTLSRRVRRGLGHDLFVVSGGVSVGDRDFVAEALTGEGVEVLFHRLRLKPAKPTLFGRRGRSFVVGLPGNPVSSFVAAELVVKRVIRRLAGIEDAARPLVSARSAVALKPGSDREEYRPARVTVDRDGLLVAEPVAFRGSSDFPGLAAANAFVVIAPGAPATPPGAVVRAHLLAGRGLLS